MIEFKVKDETGIVKKYIIKQDDVDKKEFEKQYKRSMKILNIVDDYELTSIDQMKTVSVILEETDVEMEELERYFEAVLLINGKLERSKLINKYLELLENITIENCVENDMLFFEL